MADEKYESDFESDSEGDESLLDVSPDDVEMGEMIGGGGLGLVYAAKWKKKEVAVKMLFDPRVSEALIKEFRDEAMVQWGLNHPNIVKLYACCVKPPKMLMIFDKSDGSLFEVLHKYVLLHSSSPLFFGASRQLKLNSIFRRMTSFSSFRQTYELRRSEAWEIALAVAKGMNHLHTHNPKV
uniref:Protein kinase domain-containing protein n=1 Tax=Palpitomonas bilix TaxID=652834 RepID=A0A7S3GMD2_9EUKA|mmetsp:Transcript_9407/g.25515  ORF Transcript_9407/g.25515 Transcript_9407/m.25515 type:complete len:181 (+) Transcript_9407:161-703(+)